MKKRIAFINVVCNGSTGKIMCDLAQAATNEGFEAYCFYGRGEPKKSINCIKIGNKLSILFHVLLARLGFNGHGSYFATKKFIKRLRNINPDIIHMHNIHGYYLNLKVLFKYLNKEYKGKVIWTLHDCWAFTGHCSHYTDVGCSKWKTCCYNCPQLKSYPKEYIDTVKYEYILKKDLFTKLYNPILVTPSLWLFNEVKKSYLNEFKVLKIQNGINLNVFKISADKDIYEKYKIPKNKNILLGVANVWEDRKGLKIFKELAKIINKDEIIVLVGLSKKQVLYLPKNIIGITRTDNQEELAKIYSIVDVFINPSIEETFSMVTVESLACGTPVVVCGKTATKELVSNEKGIVINSTEAKDYYDAYKQLKQKQLDKHAIIKKTNKYSIKMMAKKYIELYKEV